jgi:hypothetical protein
MWSWYHQHFGGINEILVDEKGSDNISFLFEHPICIESKHTKYLDAIRFSTLTLGRYPLLSV